MRADLDSKAARASADKAESDFEFELGRSNVFADLGFENPEEEPVKAQLVHEINAELRRRRITQRAAAELLGTEQPRISRLLRGDTTGFSTVRLFRFLNALGRDVEIIVRPAATRERAVTMVRRSSGEVPVLAASASRGAAKREGGDRLAKGQRSNSGRRS